jgi:hypothetical protein
MEKRDRQLKSLRYGLKTDDRRDEREDEEQTPERGRLMKKQNANQSGSHSPYAGPNGIGSAYGEALRGFGQQQHARHGEQQESAHPSPPGKTLNGLGTTETISKANLTEAGDNENNPIHI